MSKPPSKEAYELFHEGSIALARVERNGMKIDVGYLNNTIRQTEERVASLKAELEADSTFALWKKTFGTGMNLNSGDQLAVILYDKLDYECHRWTEGGKTGKPKRQVDKTALDLITDLPFTKTFGLIKQLEHTLRTFFRGIHREVTEEGFLHPSYHLSSAISYRSSSSKPNSQNFPKRNEEMARLIRTCFIPRGKNRVIGEVDFKGIEVAVSACYNKDPSLIRYITDPHSDMHRDEACNLFFLEEDQVDKKGTRDASKNMWVFPQFYGSVYFQCAPPIWEAMKRRKFVVRGTEISIRKHLRKHGIKALGECNPEKDPVPGTFEYHLKECEKKLWLQRFPVYNQWKKDWWNKYKENGYFRSLTGFKYEGIFGRNDVINYGTQGSAFHCLLWSLIKLEKWLRKHKFKTKIIGQIHDSILIDFFQDELQDVLDKAYQITTIDLPKAWAWINVPMVAEIEIAPEGASWKDIQEWKRTENVWQLAS